MNSKERILITGADGFIGGSLCPVLKAAGYWTVAAKRQAVTPRAAGADEVIAVKDFHDSLEWREHLRDCSAVVHLLGRTPENASGGTAREYFYVNVDITRAVAAAARHVGVKTMVCVSSVKALGEETHGTPFTESSPCRPSSVYGLSKRAAEEMLLRNWDGSDTRLCILRPPLVYGPGVPSGFQVLEKLVRRPLPLPLKSLENRRSLVSADRLCKAILKCLQDPEAQGIYHVTDPEAKTMIQILRDVRARSRGRCGFFPCSPELLLKAARLFRREVQMKELLSELLVATERNLEAEK